MAYSAIPIPYGGAGGDGTRIKNTWTVGTDHVFVVGNVVRYSSSGGGSVVLAQANTLQGVQAIGVVESITPSTIDVVYQGEIDFGGGDISQAIVGGSSTLVPGTVYYIAQSSAGMLHSVRPEDGYIQGILIATGTKKGIVINSLQQSQPSAGGVAVNSVGMIVPWVGDVSTIPTNWRLCDGEAVRKSGENPTDDANYAFLYGVAGDKYQIQAFVGAIEPSGEVPDQNLIVTFSQGHEESPTEVCHGLCNASDLDLNKDYRIGWGGADDYAIGTIVSADGTLGTVQFAFKQEYPGTTVKSSWSQLSASSIITIRSLANGEASGSTSDRFFIPDMRARTPFGVGYSTGLANLSRGEIGGKEVHLITTDEIPDHINYVNTSETPISGEGEVPVIVSGQSVSNVFDSLAAHFTADNDPISMMPPYLSANWIIRYSGEDYVAEGTIGPTGSTGANGTTGYGYTAAHVSGDGDLYISVLFPDGSSGAAYSIGTVVGGGDGVEGPQGATGTTGLTGYGYTAAYVGNDGNLYISVLFPNGTSGPSMNIGSVQGAPAEISVDNRQVLFAVDGEITGSSKFTFDGESATFSGNALSFGDSVQISNGIYVNHRELSDYNDVGSVSSISVSGLNGTIQRFSVAPQTGFTVTATTASGSWSTQTDVVETVIVSLQSKNGITGTFGDDILCSTPKPVFCGVTGGIDILSIMRIKTAGGSLTMGFVVASGMTAPGVSLSN